jgi:hypothetical protein
MTTFLDSFTPGNSRRVPFYSDGPPLISHNGEVENLEPSGPTAGVEVEIGTDNQELMWI